MRRIALHAESPLLFGFPSAARRAATLSSLDLATGAGVKVEIANAEKNEGWKDAWPPGCFCGTNF